MLRTDTHERPCIVVLGAVDAGDGPKRTKTVRGVLRPRLLVTTERGFCKLRLPVVVLRAEVRGDAAQLPSQRALRVRSGLLVRRAAVGTACIELRKQARHGGLVVAVHHVRLRVGNLLIEILIRPRVGVGAAVIGVRTVELVGDVPTRRIVERLTLCSLLPHHVKAVVLIVAKVGDARALILLIRRVRDAIRLVQSRLEERHRPCGRVALLDRRAVLSAATAHAVIS